MEDATAMVTVNTYLLRLYIPDLLITKLHCHDHHSETGGQFLRVKGIQG